MAEPDLNTHLKKLLTEKLAASDADETCRLIHGRGGMFPGLEFLTADKFGELIYLVKHQQCSLTGDETEHILTELCKSELFPVSHWVFQDRNMRPDIKTSTDSPCQTEYICRESGLDYIIEPMKGQNPGLFTDACHIREWLLNNSLNKKILNLFSYTCSFSVAALKGGASQVYNWDMNSSALNRGRKNHQKNFTPEHIRNVSFINHNILKSFGKIGRSAPYNIVVIDPPTFQGKSFDDQKHWQPLLKRAADWQVSGGILICNSHNNARSAQWIPEMAVPLGYSIVERLAQPLSCRDIDPEGGLKTWLFTKE